MKLLNGKKKKNTWGLRILDTDQGVEIWAADYYNHTLLAKMAIFYHSGGFERFEGVREKLEHLDYNPYQDGNNSYLKDGSVETLRDKKFKEEIAEMGRKTADSPLLPIILWIMRSMGVMKRS